ncbi:3167_t:CDS:1, partial [Racocetra fulgida]
PHIAKHNKLIKFKFLKISEIDVLSNSSHAINNKYNLKYNI